MFKTKIITLMLCGSLLALPIYAQNANLLQNGDFSAPLDGTWTAGGSNAPQVEVVEAEGKKALRVTMQMKTGQNSWDSRVYAARTSEALPRHALVAVRFHARSAQSSRIGVIFQIPDPPHTKIINNTVTISPEWKEYRFIGKVDPALPVNGSNFELHTGYGTGTFEITDVRVENFGVVAMSDVEAKIGPQTLDYWGSQKPDDNWKKAAFQRIEKHRKGDVKIRVVDAAGKPIRNAKVTLNQTRQQFRWGSAVVAGRITDPATPDNLRYRAEVERLFNTIVFENDLKWDNKNPRKTEQALEALKWLQARNIAVRGHTLVWGARKWLPAEAVAAWDDTEKLREMVRNRVREQATTFKGQLYVWDVVNEAATNTELWEKLGWDEFANIFKIARQVDPTVKLAYNDYNISNESQDLPRMQKHRQRVAEIIRMLKEKGAPVDIYGDQAHFGLPLTPPARMVEIWNEVAKLGLPIELTELDAGIPEDKLHGEYIRDVLIAAFSVPQVEGVIMWGFWEGAHWRAGEGGAMFRKDWSKRPAQEAYEDLVLKQWRTKTAGTTNARGEYSTRGFLGDYNVMVSVKGKTHTMRTSLPRHGRNLIIKIM